jgi:hypothetical protein
MLDPLSKAVKAAIVHKSPLRLNNWRAHEIAIGAPIGESAVLDPVGMMRELQLGWLPKISTQRSLSGIVHRAVACPSSTWAEPSAALASALADLGWHVRRNPALPQAIPWPQLPPEPSFPGTILLEPVDDFPPPGAVYTDGSVMTSGGAAVCSPETESAETCCIPAATSSTECELIARCLALRRNAPHVSTDSLTSLQLLRSWHRWSAARVLRCELRVLVRLVLSAAAACPVPPTL